LRILQQVVDPAFKFQFVAPLDCVRRERCPQRSVRKFDLDGQIFCIFHTTVQKILRFALGTLRTAFPTGLLGNYPINCNLSPLSKKKDPDRRGRGLCGGSHLDGFQALHEIGFVLLEILGVAVGLHQPEMLRVGKYRTEIGEGLAVNVSGVGEGHQAVLFHDSG